jgi:phosphomannomutase
MSDAPLMLGVSGLRGIVGQSLTPEVAARFAGAFGGWLRGRGPAPTVVVGRDGRAGAQEIYGAALDGLLKSGCDVVDLGVAMTPTVGVMVDEQGAAGGMVVTASHNPQEWNGLKCLIRSHDGDKVDASAPPLQVANEIINEFRLRRAPSGLIGTSAWVDDVVHKHVFRVLMNVEMALGSRESLGFFKRSLPVTVDSVNASGVGFAASLLRMLRCRVTHLGSARTGLFAHPPEPLRENLGELCESVRQSRSEIGFAQDPDADRLAIVDERGEYIGEEYTLALAAQALLGAPPAAGTEKPSAAPSSASGSILVTNLSTSRMIDDLAARYGARVVRTAVGEANVVEAMKREKAAGRRVILGGEGNGGVIWPEVTYVRDSLSAMALVLALMARTGKKVSELVAGIPAYAIEKRKVDLARKEDAAPAVEKIAAAYRAQTIDRQDGVRVDWPARRAWLHVRASNTEPIMRLIAEAPTAAESRTILDEAAAVIGKS